MVVCKNCGKNVNYIASKADFRGNRFCSSECRTKFTSKKYPNKDKIKEIKCKCNQCGNTWHYLESDEKLLNMQAGTNACIGLGMCCSPIGAFFSNKSIDTSKELAKMKKCPKCNSSDVTKTEIYHDKKS